MRDITALLRGGYCTRWHANPDLAHMRETLAEHHGRVAQILLALHPAPTIQLIDAALHHDAGEPSVGDVPWPAKRDNPGLSEILDAAEEVARDRLGVLIRLTGEDQVWLKMADRLAAYAHVARVAPRVLTTRDWRMDRDAILESAEGLGVHARVSRVLCDLEAAA